MARKSWTTRAAVLLAVALLVTTTACSGSSKPKKDSATNGKLSIALSNSYIGNQWRIEMVNIFRAACAMPPYKDNVDCPIFNSGNDVSKQSQHITNLISQGVDAIVLDAASSTGLNGVVKQACDRGIVVVAFDNVPTEPCVVEVSVDQGAMGKLMAEYLVQKLNGTGNVVMVTGVAGAPADTARNAGAEEVFKANPGIKVVAKYPGEWDSATAQRNTATQLPSLPKVDGVWVSAGTDGVIKAFLDAKRPLPAFTGESENGFRKYLLGKPGPKVQGVSTGTPPFLAVLALEYARAIVRKEVQPKDILIPLPKVTDADVKEGETVFPDQPDSFYASFTDSGPNATVKLCIEAALVGTPCDGDLKVNLPK
jgi:ribose transport system substrate-binding protein